jgi:predicted aldo/keto reductase-like oxidoreductase
MRGGDISKLWQRSGGKKGIQFGNRETTFSQMRSRAMVEENKQTTENNQNMPEHWKNIADENEYQTGLTRRQFVLWALATSLLSMPMKMAFAGQSHSEMPYRKLGSTGEKVSAIGIGGYHIGLPDETEAIQIIRTAIDKGVNFMDNCWDYHDGQSEERMGKALQNGYRDKVLLMSKIDGRNRKAAVKQMDQSLKRLRTDRIDLLQIHEVIRLSDPDRCFAEDGVVQALLEAKKAGKIRYIGFTGHKSPEIHLKMLATADKHNFHFDAVQMPLNVMDAHYDSFEQKVLPVLLAKKIAVLGMKPMGAGMILRSHAVTAPECLKYALSLPTSVVITGCDSMKILEQALTVAAQFKPLSADERQALLLKTVEVAHGGRFELYKTSPFLDGTTLHPDWLG